MGLEQNISRSIMEAMKARNEVRLRALRNAKKYIIEAKTSGKSVDELSDQEVIRILTKLAKQGTDSADIYTQQGRPELAAAELAEVEVLREFLPAQLDSEALATELRAIIAELGASSPADMGRVMGVASKRLAGRADGREISARVKELLA